MCHEGTELVGQNQRGTFMVNWGTVLLLSFFFCTTEKTSSLINTQECDQCKSLIKLAYND